VRTRRRICGSIALVCAVLTATTRTAAQSRFLARADILLYGIALKVEPSDQTVPKNIATIVSTFLTAPSQVGDNLPPFAPDAIVMATLRGPSFQAPLDLTTAPNTPFNIPPLPVAGLHTLENIRLVSNGEVLLRGIPESVTINVIDKLLVTQITARPLTAAEIREKNIVFDKSNFQAYNFTAAFAVTPTGAPIKIDIPVVLPSLAPVQDAGPNRESLPIIAGPALKTIQTIIPDTLKIQTQVPNLSVTGFTLKLPELKGQNFFVPPIPGVIVIPGDIGFLNQFFSVMLLVSNVAPDGSHLVVSDLHASILLPPGQDGVVGSGDDPLAMARTEKGESPRVQLVSQPGADNVLGTADDVVTLGPGETGNAEFLVEGRREGSHVVEIELEGTLNGLPVGPIPISGRAAGAVLVRNPSFTLTFVHPEEVDAGEQYPLDVAVTNTSESPANFVSINLFPRNISGATLVGEPSQNIDFIAPGDSATVTFQLISQVTGKVTAATLESDGQVAGRFELKHVVGEFGVLSPESLILPKEASALPKAIRDAGLGLLGKAFAVATAPPAALPKDTPRFSKQVVLDMAVNLAQAGLRIGLQEPVRDSITQLAMDFFGSLYTRLPSLNPKPADLDFAQSNYKGFDELRRRSTRGDVFAKAIADVLAPDLHALGVAAFHKDVAEKVSYRPIHISALVGTAGAPLPVTMSIVDGQNRSLGGTDSTGKVIKQIPFGDYLPFSSGADPPNAQMAFLVAPESGDYAVHLDAVPGAATDMPFTLSLIVPRADGTLRHLVFENITLQSTPTVVFAPSDPYRLSIVTGGNPSGSLNPTTDEGIVEPPPAIVSVIQQAKADILVCAATQTDGPEVGRIIAVLFSKEVTAASVQDKLTADQITGFSVDGNRVVGSALQPGGRVVFLGLRDPIGPFVPRSLTVTGVSDLRGHILDSQTHAIVSTIDDDGGVVSGHVLHADGTPVPLATVSYFTYFACGEGNPWRGISTKTADADGAFSWDFVLRRLDRIVAIESGTEDFRDIQFQLQRSGQRVNLDVVLLGRGTFQGRTLDEQNRPLKDSVVKITSLTDQSQFGATSAADGSFTVARVPVGNILVEAVNVKANAQTFISESIPFAGATTTHDLTLFDQSKAAVTIKHGDVTGHVLHQDSSAVAGISVFAYYVSDSQPGVPCPAGDQCPVARATTDDSGAFAFPQVVAGTLSLQTFEQSTLRQGEAVVTLAADGSASANIILTGGLGTVHGTVLDSNGHPVAGARVGGGLSLTTTDGNGTFTLTDVPVGRTSIVAVSDELRSSESVDVDIAFAGEEVSATIVLKSVGGVAGVVRLSDNTPAAGISVYLFEFLHGNVHVVASAVTDDQGLYTMSGIPLGDYTLSAFKADFSDGNVAELGVKFSNQIVKGDLTFRGGDGKVTGHVFAADGVTPLKARVSISGDQVVIAGGKVGVRFQHVDNYRIVDTDFTTGAFTLGGIFVGTFTVRAAGEFSPDPIALENTIPSAGATVPMDIRLQPTSTVSGQVFLPDGVTPAAADIVVKYKSDEFKSFCSENEATGETECITIPQGIQEEVVVTDAQGRFGFPLVNPGTFTLTVQDNATGRIATARGSVKAGENAALSIRLLGTGDVTVQVFGSDTTTPIPGAKVVIQQLDYPKKSATIFANSLGVAMLGGADSLTEGAFVVLATDTRNGFAGRGTGKVQQDGDHVVVKVFLYNQSGSVVGTVFRSDGLTPVSNGEVVISRNGQSLAFALTDASGAYSVNLIPLGPFDVDVFEAATARRGFATGSIDLDGQVVPVYIVEAALGTVRGTVLEAGSLQPLKGWQVSLSQTVSGRSVPSLATMSSVDGTFSFPGISKGGVSLRASKPDVLTGPSTATGQIEREGQVIDVPVIVPIIRPTSGSIEGLVLNADGSPAANAIVTLCAGDCVDVTTSDTAGHFTLTQLPLGRYSLRARSQTTASSGDGLVQIQFDGDAAAITIVMVTAGRIEGLVVRADGTPAASARLTLNAFPGTGCQANSACVTFADANGAFAFNNVPANRFTIQASDPVTGFKGAIGDTLEPPETKSVQIVLEPTASVRARVLLQNGTPAGGVVAELIFGSKHLFTQSAADGTFAFDTTPLGPFVLNLQDPLGSGVQKKFGTITGPIDLGDIQLDETPPGVATVTPSSSAVSVPLNQVIRIAYTEKIDISSINASSITLSDGTSLLAGTIHIETGDMAATFTPVNPLKESTRYTIRVKDAKDLVGKVMTQDFVSAFTSIDLTPPSYLDISPAPNTPGVTVATTVRLTFSEPIDPSKFAGTPIVVTGPQGAIAGRTDFLFNNTVLAFTPTFPLVAAGTYRVQAARATDLSSNIQPTALDYQFTTADGSAPHIVRLVAPASVVENGVATITAETDAFHDVGLVDFFINGAPATTSRSAPFKLLLQAAPTFGKPGDRIKVSAAATDTSGIRGAIEGDIFILVTPDQPPVVTITQPQNGLTARNGDRIDVTVRAVDDLGVTKQGYKAQTGRPQDAAITQLAQSSLDHTESYGFNIPLDAPPGATILVEASASDTKGQVGQATPVAITVLDSVPPNVTITGATTGNLAKPGQVTTVVVSADDLGSIQTVNFSATGAATFTDARILDPAQPSALVSFTFTVPSAALPGDSVTLHASAVDKAGNVGVAANLILPVADTVAPTVTLSTDTGSLNLIPGRTVTVIASASDSIAVSRVDLTGSGAFAITDGKQVSPALPSAQVPFTINVPAAATPGAVLNLQARATDTSNNTSLPALLSLTVKSLADITLPGSVIVDAGRSVPMSVDLSAPAPDGGQVVTFTTANPGVATVTPSVSFAAGESSKTISVSGVSGGSVKLSAFVQGIERASSTIVVQGGVIDGQVFDPTNHPLAGAQVTVTGGNTLTTVTDANGFYEVVGILASPVTVTALDPVSQLHASSTASMNAAKGFAHINVALTLTGTVRGTVRLANGQTAAGAGVEVDLFASNNLLTPIASTFTTAGGAYVLANVVPGTWIVDANSTDGNRGRASVTVSSGGQATPDPADVVFVGRGTVTGTVLNANGQPVPNAQLTFSASSIFGATNIIRSAGLDGTFRFDSVFVGSFQISARDPVTNRGATRGGSIVSDGQLVDHQDLILTPFNVVRGTVYRFDRVTTVPNASVSIGGQPTVTDATGHYEFPIVPTGPVTVNVTDAATRGKGTASGTVVDTAPLTLDVYLLGQGSVVVTVVTAKGVPEPGAQAVVNTVSGTFHDTLAGTTNANGVVAIDHVLAGDITATASSNSLNSGAVHATLSPDQVLPLTVTLEPTGSIAGQVFAPDGKTPQTNGNVQLIGPTAVPQVTIADDGTFRFDRLKLGSYQIFARDTRGFLRATANLDVHSDDVPATLTFVAAGNVVGRVIYPEGLSAPNLTVQVRSLNAQFGRFASAQTKSAGDYEVDDLAAGVIDVSVADPARGLLGEASGRIEHDGETLTLDILLTNNGIALPKTLLDANTFQFDVQPAGSIAQGTASAFSGPLNLSGGSLLDIVDSGTPIRFVGNTVGTVEDQGRELVVRQQNIAGLDVTRKIFVPREGYFARYLELLSNPTAAPITIGLRVTSFIKDSLQTPTNIVSTSSGDAVLDVADPTSPDRWIVVDDNDVDPFVSPNVPSLGLAFGGASAADNVDAASYTAPASGAKQLTYDWTNITIPPGSTVGYMHFIAQQTSRAGAIAAVQRLVQSPPEALAGLSPDEIAEVQNFSLPPDGVSALDVLPPLDGSLTGRLLASDGQTAVPNATVTFASALPFFGRTLSSQTTSTGSFTFAGNLTGTSTQTVVPAGAFTLAATHPQTGLKVSVNGAFAAGESTTTQDVVFVNSGTVTGVVTNGLGAPIAGAVVHLKATSNTLDITSTSDGSGAFVFSGVAPGSYQIIATPIVVAVAVTAGQTQSVAIVVDSTPPQVSITSPSSGALIDPRSPLPVSVSASDFIGVAQTSLTTSGAASFSETRPISPAVTSRVEQYSVPFATLPPTGGSLTLSATARDGAGNQANTTVVVSVLDVVPPSVQSISPAAGAIEVDTAASVVVTFSEPVARASVTATSLSLNGNGGAVTATVAFGNGDRTVTLTPSQPLAMNRVYTLTATQAITDVAGNPLSAVVASSFKTKSPDSIPPKVSAIIPANGAVNVPIGSDIEVTFSEAIDRTTISSSSFRVSVDGSPIAGNFIFAGNDTVVRFIPASPLPFDAIGVVELTSAITDLFQNALVDAAGNALVTPLTFTFSTGTFGISKPASGTDVLENSQLILEAKASGSLNVATVVFAVNGQALTPVAAPFTTIYAVGSAASTPTLTIVATAKDAGGATVAQDQVVVPVTTGLSVRSRILGVPLGGAANLRLFIANPLAADLNIQVNAVNSTIAAPVAGSAVISAGQTETSVAINGLVAGATTITATSARGNSWAIASVSAPTTKTLNADAAATLVVASTARSFGRVLAGTSQQQPVTLTLTSAPVAAATTIFISSSNASVATVADTVILAAGTRTAVVPIATGAAGSAVLTFVAGGEISQITVVVGPPFADPPLTIAPAVGVVVTPLTSTFAGRVFTPTLAQQTIGLKLLSNPAGSTTPVTVTSSNPSIASVPGNVSVGAGLQTADVSIQTGSQGVATLTFVAGSDTRQLTVVVGTPPPDLLPPVSSNAVGVVVLQSASAELGRVFTGIGGQSSLGVRLVSSPVATNTPVTVTTSDPNIAMAAGAVVIPAGSQSATVTIGSGVQGVATLTFTVGTEKRELTVVVGTPPAGLLPLVISNAVGVMLVPDRQAGRVYSAIGGQPSLTVPLLSDPAATDTAVTVTSSDPNIAGVTGLPFIPAGGRSASLNITTGNQGVATLTIFVGAARTELVVVVGNPPASLLPVITAPAVGVQVKQ
jgi:hypothetical protein